MCSLIRVLLLFTTIFCGYCSGYYYNTTVVRTPQHDKYVACYFQSWAIYRNDVGIFNIDDIRPEYCTTLIYSFAGINATSFEILSLDNWADLATNSGKNGYHKFVQLRYKYSHLKILLAVGGWNEGGKKFSDMARTEYTRKKFIQSAISFLRMYDFDGLDLDWEFPGDNGGSEYDKFNFIELVKELKKEFVDHRLILTAAISADTGTMDKRYDVRHLSTYLDMIHVMTYDYNSHASQIVLPNAPIHSVNFTMEFILKKGINPRKLSLGLATYGKGFILEEHLRSPSENPIGKRSRLDSFAGSFTPGQKGIFGYNEICKSFLSNTSWTSRWDNMSSTPYLINRDQVIVYDNARSLQAKVQLAMNLGLGGVFVWSIDTDDFRGDCVPHHKRERIDIRQLQYPLMNAITVALERGANGSSNLIINPICLISILLTACFYNS